MIEVSFTVPIWLVWVLVGILWVNTVLLAINIYLKHKVYKLDTRHSISYEVEKPPR